FSRDWSSDVCSSDLADAFRKALTLNPNIPIYQVWLAHAEGTLGNREQALEALGRAEQLPTAHRSAITIANLAYAYAMNGRREDEIGRASCREGGKVQ